MTRIDELLAETKRLRAEIQSRGLLSDPGRLDSRQMKALDEAVFIIKGQFKTINKQNSKIRKLEKRVKVLEDAMRTPEAAKETPQKQP